jgi:hypothetical protein
MRFKNWAIIILFFILSGCGKNEIDNRISTDQIEDVRKQVAWLREQNDLLEQKNHELKEQVEQLSLRAEDNNISMNYTYYEQPYRFIDEPTIIRWMPDFSSPVVREIENNRLVKVLFAGHTSGSDVWLYISFVTLDSPNNNQGWVHESKTAKYTEGNQLFVTDIIIPKGMAGVDKYKAGIEETDQWGLITRREEDKVLVTFAGGKEDWYYVKDIRYPPLN